MSRPERWCGMRPGESVTPPLRALPALSRQATELRAETPTILAVGAVPGLGWTGALGRMRRSRWGAVTASAVRSRADLVVVGRPPFGVDAVAVIARLKDDPATAAIPVLHSAPAENRCTGCRADVCLSVGSISGQLARVAEALLGLARARARRSGLFAARGSLAAGEVSRPAL